MVATTDGEDDSGAECDDNRGDGDSTDGGADHNDDADDAHDGGDDDRPDDSLKSVPDAGCRWFSCFVLSLSSGCRC